MNKLENYVGGKWVTGDGDGQQLYNAVTGEIVATATSKGLDFKEMTGYARKVGNRNLRRLTFHERGRMLKELALHEVYRTTRQWREQSPAPAELEALGRKLLSTYSDEWLPMLETYELMVQGKSPSPVAGQLKQALEALAAKSEETTRDLITKGLALSSVKD